MRGAVAALVGSGLLLCAACTDDVNDEYAPYQAFLRVMPVTAAPPLREALTGPGMFCAVTVSMSEYKFSRPDGTWASLPKTALDSYGSPKCIAGFIVGTPDFPDLSGQFYAVAYDLACPACNEQDYIKRSLVVGSDKTASCGRCGRVYDLQNAAVKEGEKGRSLYKYHLTYAPAQDLLTIWN